MLRNYPLVLLSLLSSSVSVCVTACSCPREGGGGADYIPAKKGHEGHQDKGGIYNQGKPYTTFAYVADYSTLCLLRQAGCESFGQRL